MNTPLQLLLALFSACLITFAHAQGEKPFASGGPEQLSVRCSNGVTEFSIVWVSTTRGANRQSHSQGLWLKGLHMGDEMLLVQNTCTD